MNTESPDTRSRLLRKRKSIALILLWLRVSIDTLVGWLLILKVVHIPGSPHVKSRCRFSDATNGFAAGVDAP
jgi:hypothetical protein